MNLEQKTITSVEVADMVGKEHKELLRAIRRYAKQLTRAILRWLIFLRKVATKTEKGKADHVIWLQRKAVNLLLTSSLV